MIEKYFGELTQTQRQQFASLSGLYAQWNEQINVISRKDLENFEERHLLHSLFIAKVCTFGAGTRFLDIGTGGGFPGIPLAIMFPNCKFHLVDSIGKKIKVVQDVAQQIGLKNVVCSNTRAESLPKNSFDVIVSRAVSSLETLWAWSLPLFSTKIKPESGLYCLKGGDLDEELGTIRRHYQLFDIKEHFEEAFFETKKLVVVPFS